MNQSNCMVAQSGGPTAAINASLAGVISGIKKSGKYDTCYGAINGILGILNERYLNLSQMIPDEKTLNRLKVTPAISVAMTPWILYLNYPIMPPKSRATSGLSEFQRPLTTIYA